MSGFSADLLMSAAVPAVLVAILFFFLGGLKDPVRTWVQAATLALGFALAGYFVTGRLTFPSQNVAENFSWSALLLAVFVVASPRSVNARYFVRALFVIAVGALILWPIREMLSGHVNLRNLLAFFFLALGVWSILERAAQSVQPLTLIALPWIALAGTILLLKPQNPALGKSAMIFAGVLFGVGVVAGLFGKRVSQAAVLPFVSVFVVTFMAAGHFYLHVNPWHMVFLCIPFLLLWVRNMLPFIPRKPLIETLILGALSILPLLYLFKIGPDIPALK